jgi:hypothetical protein
LSSVYIFYCFDKKFRREGINSNNIPNEIREILDGANNGRGNNYQDNAQNIGTEMQFRNNNQGPNNPFIGQNNNNWGPKPNFQNQGYPNN